MAETTHVDFKVFDGPNLLVPYAAVVAEVSGPFISRPPPEYFDHILAEVLPGELAALISQSQAITSFEHLAAALANALQDLHGANGYSVQIQQPMATMRRIALGYHDVQATTLALQTGLEYAIAVYTTAADRATRLQNLAKLYPQVNMAMRLRQPDYIARALIRAAHKQGVPVYPVTSGSRVWQYGQGQFGQQFFEAANHHDALTGARIARDKFESNQLVMRLGFPGVKHGIANNIQTALQLARQFGFPVVAKPLNRGKGMGVTPHVMTEADLVRAFEKANRYSPGTILVEQHVQGDDHRLMVLDGKLAWGVQRKPPQVTGDGLHTIAELISMANAARSTADVAAGYTSRLEVDTDMQEHLARKNLTTAHRPAQGVAVSLRSIANASTGGTVRDCTADIHPENREMAEAIARNFHLDAAGIDFMTSDIRRSWREIPCAVIEVNQTPAIFSEQHAAAILHSKFPPGITGRTPSIVLIGCTAQALAHAAAALQKQYPCVGQTDNTTTLLGGHLRFSGTATLPARVTALLLDASCAALVIGITPEEIARHGFPLDRCDLALIADSLNLAEPMQRLIWQCAATVIDGVSDRNINRTALPAIAKIAGQKAAVS